MKEKPERLSLGKVTTQTFKGSNVLSKSTAAATLPAPQKLAPDYGTKYLEMFGTMPLSIYIENPSIITGGSEGNICWKTGEYMGTLIVTPEFAEQYKQDTSQMLKIVPDPDDAYTTGLGERVVPFKLAA